MPYGFKDFKDLTLADDFMFGEIMRQPRFCKPFLEELLQTKIAEVVAVDKQKDLQDDYEAHGIRLDVYLEDENRTKYDIEMQTTTQPYLEKRIRYYTGGIDRHSLEPSEPYSAMRDTFVIFICLTDYYRAGLALYERESRVKGTEIPYEDGSHAYILNANYTKGNASPEVLKFLDYLKARWDGKPFDTSGSELLDGIDDEIERIKLDEGKERAYMTMTMKMQDIRRESLEEGREEGRLSVVKTMLERGLSPKEIRDMTGVPLEEIESVK